MNGYKANHSVARSVAIAALLILGSLVSACSLQVNTQAGQRIYPSPQSTALGDVAMGHAAPAVSNTRSIPPLSVCLPEFEAPDPAGFDIARESVILVRQRPTRVEAPIIHAALVEALRKHGVDARPLDDACRHGFVRNGDTRYYLRPTVLYVERHYQRRQRRSRVFSSLRIITVSQHRKTDPLVYQSTYAIALELSVYRQGGKLVFQSRQAGAARLDDTLSDDELLAVSLDRLVADLLTGRIIEVLP